jgi:hypothetical protein
MVLACLLAAGMTMVVLSVWQRAAERLDSASTATENAAVTV